jgi:hypothetical protein
MATPDMAWVAIKTRAVKSVSRVKVPLFFSKEVLYAIDIVRQNRER